jgi:ribosomal protein S18 acetylase RimI-like enzyme
MTLQIREVNSTKDLNAFIRFPHVLYRNNPYWVPSFYSDDRHTLSPEENAAFEFSRARYWLALREGKVVGRVAAILSEGHQKRWQQAYMRFGWLDFIDDLEVSSALLAQVEEWAREMKSTAVHGPLGFTDMDQAGMLVEGFEELGTMATIYNYPYYSRHLEQLGYVKDTDWVEYELTVPQVPDPKITKLAELIMKRNGLRMLDAKSRNDILPYASEIFALVNEGYYNLYGYVPLNDRQIKSYTKQYFGFIRPDFVPIVLNAEGKMVAFGITMPSLSKAMQKAKGRLFPFGFIHLLRALNKNDRADLYLVVVKPEYQGMGVNALLISKINETFIKAGIRKAESNPELETNTQVQAQWKHFEKRQHKRRRCYIKQLG